MEKYKKVLSKESKPEATQPQKSQRLINDYVRDIRSATLTIDPIFRNFKDGREHQLNPNTLQIEDEYYAVARAKSNCNQYKRTSSNLLEGGIDFIEIRSLDQYITPPTLTIFTKIKKFTQNL